MTTALARQREHMVATQLVRRGIHDAAVLRAMGTVPRERFVEPGFEKFAHDDTALPIAHGQTLSQPYIVALMAQAAGLTPGDRVLEVGAGSGYAAAVLSHLAEHVTTVERHPLLAATAAERLATLGVRNAQVVVGDGTRGWAAAGPFDAILVSAGAPAVPPALQVQLADGGRLVIPVGGRVQQRLVLITRHGDEFTAQDLAAVHFVPLVGEHGWADEPAALPTARRGHVDVRDLAPLPLVAAQAAAGTPDAPSWAL